MGKYKFKNDYSEGAHPLILDKLRETNYVQQEGYGLDDYSLQAAERIKEIIRLTEADVHFLSGGTQTNMTLISAALRPHEAVIAADTAHINVHEAGAVEAVGHKIYQLHSSDGKITPEQIEQAVKFHADEHFVKPKLVFVSNATELGTVYTKAELESIYRTCQKYNLYLYLDGARLGNAVVASDLSLADVASFTDAFYIGGTKNGALLGEALIITNPELKKDFRYIVKQHGGLLAKGRVMGIQFLELFKENLYFELASHANLMAQTLRSEIENLGFNFFTDSPTNQIFPIFPNDLIERLMEKFEFYVWQPYDEKSSVVRLVTSWATPEDAVKCFVDFLKTMI